MCRNFQHNETSNTVGWCSWLSHQSNTLKVPSSNLGLIMMFGKSFRKLIFFEQVAQSEVPVTELVWPSSRPPQDTHTHIQSARSTTHRGQNLTFIRVFHDLILRILASRTKYTNQSYEVVPSFPYRPPSLNSSLYPSTPSCPAYLTFLALPKSKLSDARIRQG